MTRLLENKVAIVTGAGQGIGAGVARVFAREGARLVLAGRHLESLESTQRGVAALGADSVCVVADVSVTADCGNLVRETLKQFGSLDCAVNNAGTEGVLAPAAEYPEENFDHVIAVNLKGVWNCMRFQIPEILKRGGGSIVNVSSALAEVAQYNMCAYLASKYGVVGLSKAAALDYATQGLRVNALLPGLVETPMMTKMMAAHPSLREPLLAAEPIGRFGRPEELGEAAAWLCSDRASFQTGSSMVVDGGYLLR